MTLAVFLCFVEIGASGARPMPEQDPKTAASVRIKSDVSGVQVLLDGEEVGLTPLTLRTVAAGTHELTLIKDGYEDHTESVKVVAGQRHSLFIVMQPLDTELPPLPIQFPVVHQHRLGRCVGVLTVAVEAIDFKADQGQDVFHLRIRDLKSVSRSWGGIPGVNPVGINAPTDSMAFRVEEPGRSYGFVVYEKDGEKLLIAPGPTKELFEVVYKLWTATLDSR